MDAQEEEKSDSVTIIYSRQQPEKSRLSDSGLKHFKYMHNLSRFLEELHLQTELRTSEEECKDIYSAVTDMVWEILHLVARINPLYKVSKLLSVGSYAERTRLVHPSEFDFVAEIELLSVESRVRCKAECNNLGCVHIVLQDQSLIKQLDRIIYHPQDTSDKFCSSECIYISPTAFRKDFWSCFNVATHLMNLMGNGAKIDKNSGSLTLFSDLPHLDLNLTGPNMTTVMCWMSSLSGEELGISVDVTPVVTISNDIPQSCGVDMQMLHEVTGGSYQMRVVPTVNRECENGNRSNSEKKLCWRLSFSVMETGMVQRMKDIHKKCLRLLKYIKGKHGKPLKELESHELIEKGLCTKTLNLINYLSDMNFLTTYMMKMAVLSHDLHCKEKDENLGECMLSVVGYLRSCAEDSFLSNVFMPGKNSWSNLSKPPGVGPALMFPIIDKLVKVFEEIADKEDYNYKDSFDNFSAVQQELVDSDRC